MKGYLLLVCVWCIVALSKGGWVRVWADDFNWNGGVDMNKWDFEGGGDGWHDQEQQYYTRNRQENARCELFPGSSNGRLIIQARKEDYNGSRFTSARMKSKVSWTYGRLQIRALLPSGRGLLSALWLLPQKQTYGTAYWPDNGELDLMQQVGFDPLSIHSTLHTEAYNWEKHNEHTNTVSVDDATANFKIYTLQWAVDKLEMFVGYEANAFQTSILVWTKSGNWTSWPFDQPFFFILNLAVGGTWGGVRGVDEGIFPRQMEIDWVHFYQWQ